MLVLMGWGRREGGEARRDSGMCDLLRPPELGHRLAGGEGEATKEDEGRGGAAERWEKGMIWLGRRREGMDGGGGERILGGVKGGNYYRPLFCFCCLPCLPLGSGGGGV